MISQNTINQNFGNPTDTTIKYWAPEEKKSGLHGVVVVLANIAMYATMVIAYFTLYTTNSSLQSRHEDQGYQTLTNAIWISFLCVSIVGLLIFLRLFFTQSKYDHTVFSPGRESTYFRPDVFAGLFNLFLWSSIGIVLGHRLTGRMNLQALAAYILKMIAVVTVIRVVIGLVVSLSVKKEEDWREELQFFLIRWVCTF